MTPYETVYSLKNVLKLSSIGICSLIFAKKDYFIIFSKNSVRMAIFGARSWPVSATPIFMIAIGDL